MDSSRQVTSKTPFSSHYPLPLTLYKNKRRKSFINGHRRKRIATEIKIFYILLLQKIHFSVKTENINKKKLLLSSYLLMYSFIYRQIAKSRAMRWHEIFRKARSGEVWRILYLMTSVPMTSSRKVLQTASFMPTCIFLMLGLEIPGVSTRNYASFWLQKIRNAKWFSDFCWIRNLCHAAKLSDFGTSMYNTGN